MKNPRWILLSGPLLLLWVVSVGLAQAQPSPPTVTTLPASGVGATNATLNGIINPSGFPTSGFFQWGTTTNYGNATPVQALGNGGSDTNFSQAVGGLVAGVTYHFRAVASNSFDVVPGANQSFTTTLFTNLNAGLPGVAGGSGAWGDFDNDGRLDILLTGNTTTGAISQVWRNTGSGFTNFNAGLPLVNASSAAWGDYDNDGRLDILVAGRDTNNAPLSQVWRNTGSGFTNINAGLPGAYFSSVAWGDYDNDGRLDILLAGFNTLTTSHSQVWRNTGSGFTDINAGLPGVLGSVAWGDYDNDGRLDILLEGIPGSEIWRNTGSGFTNINAGLPDVNIGCAAWGDYDNDGRLDLLLTGTTSGFSGGAVSQVWRNTGSGFTNINAGLPGVFRGSATWGDYDNDGRLDILLGGTTTESSSGALCQVWRNTGSGFTNLNAGLPGAYLGSLQWGDYDNDGRLDILLTGADADNSVNSQILRNSTPITNTAPTAPTGLSAVASGSVITLSWSAATDGQTPATALTYNIRIGTNSGEGNIISPMAASTGYRRVPRLGNVEHRLSNLRPLVVGQTYYWSVQAVDAACAGSPFSTEHSFTLGAVYTPPNGIPVSGDLNGDGIVSQSELNTVLSNYFPYSPFLLMTNVAGLGGTNVTFALSNSIAGVFSVEYSTNLTNWLFLGPATPRYLFTDTNAPAVPQRYYRLRWP